MPDRIDLDHLEQTAHSAGYAAIVKRCQAIMASKLRHLVTPLDMPETCETRGFIRGIEACLRVPYDLKAEGLRAKSAKLPRKGR